MIYGLTWWRLNQVNRALLSRCRVVRLSKLSDASMTRILVRAISCWLEDHENELWAPSSVEEGLAALLPAELILPAAPEIGAKEDAGEAPETSEGVPIANSSATDTNTKHPPLIDKEIMTYLASMADGDARVALNGLEMVLGFVTKRLQQGNSVVDQAKWSAELLKGLRSSIALRYDRSGDDRYDMISALHVGVFVVFFSDEIDTDPPRLCITSEINVRQKQHECLPSFSSDRLTCPRCVPSQTRLGRLGGTLLARSHAYVGRRPALHRAKARRCRFGGRGAR